MNPYAGMAEQNAVGDVIHLEFNIEGGNFSRAGFASSELKKLLKKLNVDAAIIKRTVVACYEAEVNVVAHAFSANLIIEIADNKLNLVFDDRGPGISDIDKAMQEGFSTASAEVREMGFGAGMGLPNMKRNADHLEISSLPGKGTTVKIIMNLQ